jgi:hypothetical protein
VRSENEGGGAAENGQDEEMEYVDGPNTYETLDQYRERCAAAKKGSASAKSVEILENPPNMPPPANR